MPSRPSFVLSITGVVAVFATVLAMATHPAFARPDDQQAKAEAGTNDSDLPGRKGAEASPSPEGKERAKEAVDADKTEKWKKGAEKVVMAVMAVFNDESGAADNPEERLRKLRRYYASDRIYGANDLPIYFGPTDPVHRGSVAHLDNLNTSFEVYRKNGIQFRIVPTAVQTHATSDMAVVVVDLRNEAIDADGEVEVLPGRNTTVLRRFSGDQWLIIHEHQSNYSDEDKKNLKRVRDEIDRPSVLDSIGKDEEPGTGNKTPPASAKKPSVLDKVDKDGDEASGGNDGGERSH